MLGNCENKKMMTATNQWTHPHPQPQPQPQILDDQKNFMASTVSKNKVMEKTNQDHQQEQILHLKCPRCDSSNTKFCYYNNYSLSQPRHFCKACKRYWTRGGTLRNVPVGGGCRKNKRLKRHPPPPPPSSNGADGISSAASTATTSPSIIQPHIDLSSTSNHINNPMFYSMPSNNYHLGINNFPFYSRFNSNRVSSDSNEFDFQMSGVGLGFVQNYDHEYKNGFNPVKQIQDSSVSTSPSSLVSGAAVNDSILFGSSNFASTSAMASLLASSLQHQKFITNGLKDVTATNSFPGLMPVEDMQMPNGNGGIEKEVKNIGQNRLDWNPNPVEQINSSDSSSLLWNSAYNVGSWFDPSNMGSSVPSLI